MLPVSTSPVNRYIATVGHGVNSRCCSVSLGVCCIIYRVWNQFNLPENEKYEKLYSLPSLTDETEDVLAVISTTKRTFSMIMSHMTLSAQKDYPFIDKEKTINMDVFNGTYVQVTPSQVRFIQKGLLAAKWECGSDCHIVNSYIGHNYVTIVTSKDEICCLRLVNESNEYRIIELERKVVSYKINCVLERDNYILVAVPDRSIRFFMVVGNVLEDRGTFPVDWVPTCMYTFSNLQYQCYRQYASSNDSILLVGSNDGVLIMISLHEDGQNEIVYSVKIDNEQVFFSPCIVGGIPSLLVSSGSTYYMIYRNDLFRLIPLFMNLDSKAKIETNFSITSHMNNLFVHREKTKSTYLMWQDSKLIYLDIDTRSTDISISSLRLSFTPRMITPLPEMSVFISGYDIYKQSNPPHIIQNNAGKIFLKDLFKQSIVKYDGILVQNEAISAVLFLKGDANEECLLVGSFNGNTQDYYLRYYKYKLGSSLGACLSLF